MLAFMNQDLSFKQIKYVLVRKRTRTLKSREAAATFVKRIARGRFL